jgi:hypothetical protein
VWNTECIVPWKLVYMPVLLVLVIPFM